MYRIVIDRSLCSGFGACAELAPDQLRGRRRRDRRGPRRAKATTRTSSRPPRSARWARSPSSTSPPGSRPHDRPAASSSSAPASRASAAPRRCGPRATTVASSSSVRSRSPPYERPALSKEHLAGERTTVELRAPEFWSERGIELVLGRRIDAIDLVRRTAGPGLDWDALVIATGARARRLPFAVPDGRAHAAHARGRGRAAAPSSGPGRGWP